jgi:short-subunit dehydrogenase
LYVPVTVPVPVDVLAGTSCVLLIVALILYISALLSSFLSHPAIKTREKLTRAKRERDESVFRFISIVLGLLIDCRHGNTDYIYGYQMVQKKIIIVGASSGIGRAIALKYAAVGNKVGITGRRKMLLNELHEKFPDQIVVSVFDVTENQNQDKISRLISELGGLDLLVYNSGYGDPSLDLKWEIENITTRTNVNGFVEIVNFAFNYFVQQGSGQIALTSSVAAMRGNSWAPAYSASKAFMSNYAEGLNIKARRLRKDIVVTDIRPGFIKTKMAKGNGLFWVVPIEKAARQIVSAINKRKRVAYISRRWWLVAKLMKLMPYAIYRRIV